MGWAQVQPPEEGHASAPAAAEFTRSSGLQVTQGSFLGTLNPQNFLDAAWAQLSTDMQWLQGLQTIVHESSQHGPGSGASHGTATRATSGGPAAAQTFKALLNTSHSGLIDDAVLFSSSPRLMPGLRVGVIYGCRQRTAETSFSASPESDVGSNAQDS